MTLKMLLFRRTMRSFRASRRGEGRCDVSTTETGFELTHQRGTCPVCRGTSGPVGTGAGLAHTRSAVAGIVTKESRATTGFNR